MTAAASTPAPWCAWTRSSNPSSSSASAANACPKAPTACPCARSTRPEACARSEAPRGEVFYYIRTNGTDIPARLKWRVPSYMNWEALGVMMRDCAVADVALITNSIDPCVSCTER